MQERFMLSLVGRNLSKVITEDQRNLVENNRLILGVVGDDGIYDTSIGALHVQHDHVILNGGRVHHMIITGSSGVEIHALRGYRRRDARRVEVGKGSGYAKQDIRKGVRLEVEKVTQGNIFMAQP